jgi:hypothetical protein
MPKGGRAGRAIRSSIQCSVSGAQVLLSLAPGFSQVWLAANLRNRFNGFPSLRLQSR